MSLKDWFSGKKSEENAGDDKEITIMESELNELKGDMQASVQEREQALQDLKAAQTETETLKADKTSLEAQLKAAQDQIAVLEKKPDAEEAAAGKSGDENGGEAGKTRAKYSWEEKAEKKSKSLKSNN